MQIVMRKMYLLLLVLFFSTFQSIAQDDGFHNKLDLKKPFFSFDFSTMLGWESKDYRTPFQNYRNYFNSINYSIGEIIYSRNSNPIAIEGQLGYFFENKHAYFEKRRKVGIGIGIIFLSENGIAKMDSFHIEYQSKDYQNRVFRQIITSNKPITENLVINNLEIPLLFKCSGMVHKKILYNINAGLTFNLKINTEYATNASFDYEAIYHFVKGDNNSSQAIYDNSSIPSTNDWYITKSQFQKSNPGGMEKEFQELQAKGYNVGLNVKPNNKGNISNAQFSIGYIVNPQLSYNLNNQIAIYIGAYFIYQHIDIPDNKSYRLTDKVGDYNSLINSVNSITNKWFGFNLGFRYYFGDIYKVENF